MIKKLIARVQKLNPTLKEKEKNFSFALVINPENSDQDITKGSVFSIFDITSNTSFEVDVLQKLVKDVLRDTYYNSDSTSPNHSLEKSLIKVKDTIYNIQKKYNDKDSQLDLKCVLAVLWGDVLYIVKYSDSLAYIMKETTLEPIETIGEGNLNFSSLRVKPDQVAILCTKDFGIKYPPNVLLTKSIATKDLDLNDTCLLLKFLEDTSVTQEDLKFLNTLVSPTKIGIDNIIDTISQKFQTFSTFNKVENKSLFNAKPKIKSSNKDFKKIFKKLIISLTDFSKYIALLKNKKFIVTLSSILVIFITIVGFYYFKNISQVKNEDNSANISVDIVEEENITLIEEPILNDTSKDKDLNINRVDLSNALYDMTLVSNDIISNNIVLSNDTLIVLDNLSNIYTTKIDNIRFTELPYDFEKFDLFSINDEKIYFSVNGTLKDYSFDNNLVSEYPNISVNNSIGTFNQFVYTFNEDILYRYNANNIDNEPTIWAQNDFFTDAKKIQISYSIYVLNNDNQIRKYTTGRQDEFEIKGLDIDFGDINDFIIKTDFEYLYVSDPENERIVVLDTDGDFIRQYRYIDNQGFNDIKSIAVSDDEELLYVLNGNKIYEVNLE